MDGSANPLPDQRAFTLVEILVSTAVLVILLGIIFAVTGHTGVVIGRASARIDAFAASRVAFGLITQRLSEATLNTYYDYFDASNRTSSDPYYASSTTDPFVPFRYGRQSDLQFLVRQNTQRDGYGQEVYFVGPRAYSNLPDQLAAQGLLNACAFFVRYDSDASTRPAVLGSSLPARWRYRLMQGLQPTENLNVHASVYNHDLLWLKEIQNGPPSATASNFVAPVADNIIALVVWARLSGADDPDGTRLATPSSANPFPYGYDSRSVPTDATANLDTINQLPPNVQLTMVVVGEASAARLGNTETPPAAIENALDGKFRNIKNYPSDLQDLSARLVASRVQFQVFSTSVPMRESRWTSERPWATPSP